MSASRSVRGLVVLCCLSVGFCCLSAGCSLISVDQKHRYRDSEGYFEPKLLEQIRPGQTSAAWLRGHFGAPRMEHDLAQYPENVQLSTWRFTHERQKETRVFLLLRSRNWIEDHDYLHVVTENDLVVRTWTDERENVDVDKVMSVLGYKRVGSPPMPAEETAVPPPAQLIVEDVPQVDVSSPVDISEPAEPVHINSPAADSF